MPETSEYLSDFRPRFRQPSAADLCTEVPCMTTEETNEKVLEVFNRHRDLVSLPVVEGNQPIGLINRNIFLSQMSKPFRVELYGRKSCIAFMDKDPLIVDAALDLEALTLKTVAHGEKALSDGFIITREGEFAGVGNGLQLMRLVADLQVSRNRQIMHSIEYASVIQRSTLRSSLDALARACPQAHLVWEPRDVVGGDFYQFSTAPDGWFATVADCTGHGVPGAFMTLIASTNLNRAIEQHGPRDPARLLGNVNRSIKHMLGQMDGQDATPGSDDGMDAACFWFEPAQGRLVFAGARLSLFLLRPDADAVELVEGRRKGVGYMDTEFDFSWSNQELLLPPGSLVFVSTDGLIDQVGGPRAIALGKRRVRELLLEQRGRTAAQVNQAVLDALQAWQGEHHRRDDLTFFCFRT
ncbi:MULTISPECIES: SpoIIE family protein phosphatase [unclassified Variovorax]|jgi:serine phosphatase RsbU (regulator of sigma subunit)|uniref:SpoIIE family protein phosphatase n=1 Tax=unclassified Variovorax TaxID=663243 RepID=UPI000D11B3D4|nr:MULTISPECIES: SpoIIE family protein phosphatase [unclassified Variovorax]AVQ85724.1 protein-serine/threonine phosphatase [Variovorax sp. PMC12]QRY35359.1 SpoIIE family protein phosphatase [Variovorax sp. PDNC026]